jgi:hypothetical protein
LERKFWERLVKSKSPSVVEAHEEMMVEYSAQVFPESEAPEFELHVQDGENLHGKGQYPEHVYSIEAHATTCHW